MDLFITIRKVRGPISNLMPPFNCSNKRRKNFLHDFGCESARRVQPLLHPWQLWIPTFNRLLVWLDKGIELRSTDYEEDGQTIRLGVIVIMSSWDWTFRKVYKQSVL